MKAPERIETQRLSLRPPRPTDARAIFGRYASDAEVTLYVSFPRHRSVEETRGFVEFSENEWRRAPAGPYLVFDRGNGELLGGSGLSFESPRVAETGYVLARDAWGHGYATETLKAMIALARELGVRRLFARCHPEHRPSWRVLEKGGFTREALVPRAAELPNLAPGELVDLLLYAIDPVAESAGES